MALDLPALKVSQPLGEFFLTKMKASDLLKLCFVEKLEYIDITGRLKGTQRGKDNPRLGDIAKYIDSVEMAFPNSIILAANYTENGIILIDEPELELDLDAHTLDRAWSLEQINSDVYNIHIPTDEPLAAIIDGQHRIRAFTKISNPERLDIELPCAIFFDLPNAYQAFLFATINGTQKKVDRSLALELFGFNVEEETRKSWTPEKLAVYFSRQFNIKENSPFHKHIKVAPGNQKVLYKTPQTTEWTVSTATIVDGVLGLVSTKPKRDRVEMAQPRFLGRTREILREFEDKSAPLRQQYLNGEDELIYNAIDRFFNTAADIYWINVSPSSYIIKTVGILALFDFLKRILQESKGIIPKDFVSYLMPAAEVDFSDYFFQASGVGRSRIKTLFYEASGLRKQNEKINPGTLNEINRLLKRTPLDSLPLAE